MTCRISDRLGLAGLVALCLVMAAPASALQCVPYARAASGIELRGDAWKWWNAAAGVYDRGHAPRVGAVIVFRKYGKMRRGHVAVVAKVVTNREILIDHANWGRGSVSTMVAVRDVSHRNDWSEVQVWSAAVQDFGTHSYPTYGFIYPRGGSVAFKSAESGPPDGMPDFVVAMLAAPQTPSRLDDASAPLPAARFRGYDLLVELRAFVPVTGTPVDAFEEPVAPGPVATPAVALSAATSAAPRPAVPLAASVAAEERAASASTPNVVWEGDRAAAQQAGSGRY